MTQSENKVRLTLKCTGKSKNPEFNPSLMEEFVRDVLLQHSLPGDFTLTVTSKIHWFNLGGPGLKCKTETYRNGISVWISLDNVNGYVGRLISKDRDPNDLRTALRSGDLIPYTKKRHHEKEQEEQKTNFLPPVIRKPVEKTTPMTEKKSGMNTTIVDDDEKVKDFLLAVGLSCGKNGATNVDIIKCLSELGYDTTRTKEQTVGRISTNLINRGLLSRFRAYDNKRKSVCTVYELTSTGKTFMETRVPEDKTPEVLPTENTSGYDDSLQDKILKEATMYKELHLEVEELRKELRQKEEKLSVYEKSYLFMKKAASLFKE